MFKQPEVLQSWKKQKCLFLSDYFKTVILTCSWHESEKIHHTDNPVVLSLHFPWCPLLAAGQSCLLGYLENTLQGCRENGWRELAVARYKSGCKNRVITWAYKKLSQALPGAEDCFIDGAPAEVQVGQIQSICNAKQFFAPFRGFPVWHIRYGVGGRKRLMGNIWEGCSRLWS